MNDKEQLTIPRQYRNYVRRSLWSQNIFPYDSEWEIWEESRIVNGFVFFLMKKRVKI